MNYRYMPRVEKLKLRKSSIQPNLRDEYALHNNLFYGYNSTRALIGCFPVMTGHYFPVMTGHYKLGVQGIYNL